MIRIGIVGATGYTGAELIRILKAHPQVEITMLTSRQYAGTPIRKIYPALDPFTDLVCEPYDPDRLCRNTDLVFLALPHGLPMDIAPEMIQGGKKVVDLSADFRFARVSAYEKAYIPHKAPQLLDRAVYGLSEIYRDKIANADLVGNPGCYPTSILLPLIPLIRAGLVEPADIVADSKSGVSGAGKTPSGATHFCQVTESFKAYKVSGHRHGPEIAQVLAAEAQKPVDFTFVPHLVPMSRGMLTTLYLRLTKGADEKQVARALADLYHDEPFIRLRKKRPMAGNRMGPGNQFLRHGVLRGHGNRPPHHGLGHRQPGEGGMRPGGAEHEHHDGHQRGDRAFNDPLPRVTRGPSGRIGRNGLT